MKKKMIGIAGKILPRQKNRVEMLKKFRGTIPGLINSIKDANGHFSEINFKYIKKLLINNTGSNYTGYFYIDEYADTLKNEDGIIDENKFNEANKILKKIKNFKKTSLIVQLLDKFPKEKRASIFSSMMKLDNKKLDIINSIEGLIRFCFDENGDILPERYDFVHDIMNEISRQNQVYGIADEFYDMCAQNEDNRIFVKELINNNRDKKGGINLSSLAFIYKEFKTDNNTFPEDIKKLIDECIKNNMALEEFTELYKACIVAEEEESIAVFNHRMFKNALKFEDLYSQTSPFPMSINADLKVKIANNKVNVNVLDFKSKVEILNILQKVNDYISANNIEGFDYISKLITDIDTNLNCAYSSNPVTKEARNDFISNIMKVSSTVGELTPFEKVITKSIPYFENLKDGLPLEYSRKEFLEELSAICQNNPKALNIITDKTNITLITRNEDENLEITGYDGLINLDKLNQNNKTEKAIYDCMHEFLYNNTVKTGNKDLDEQLNYIIKAFPEFINTIGKKQHATHKYTLDVHQLLVLAYSINNPDYKTKLNAKDKNLIKLAGIFHDIMKKEDVVDKGHQNISSIYARNILNKVMRNPDYLDRLYDIINNHHWLEEFSTSSKTDEKIQEYAFKFRRPNDFDIAKILADSDLKAVSPDFYESHKKALLDEDLKNIENKLNEFYSNGNAIFTDYIISPSKLENHTEERNGKKYTVINLHSLSDNTDMAEYGFNHIKKNDLRFLVHMVDDHSIYKDLNTTKMLASPINGGVLSESLITPEYTRTYCNRKYGVLLSQINTNIVNEAKENQGSGCEKDFNKMLELIFPKSYMSHDRNNFRDYLLEELAKITEIKPENISNDDFAKFYKNVLASKTSIKEINPERDFNLGKYTFKGKELITAITEYQNSLIHKDCDKHNEIVGYIPKIQAVIAKEKHLKDVPEEALNFANENNLPIILL